MASASRAPPAPREGAPARRDAESLQACLLRGGAAFCVRALAMPSAVAEATNWRADLGLYEAAQLARAAPLRPGCVTVVEGVAHLHNVGDAVRRALLLAVRGASSDACLWLHLHAGHADVLPRCGNEREVGPSFVYKYVDPWTDWGAVLLFVASLQDWDVCSLVALTGWLDVDRAAAVDASGLMGQCAHPGLRAAPLAGAGGAASCEGLSADVATVRARFRQGMAAARASVGDVADFDEALEDYVNGGAAALPYARPGELRALFLAPARGVASSGVSMTMIELERELLARDAPAPRVPAQLPSDAGLRVRADQKAAVRRAAAQRGARPKGAGTISAALNARAAKPVAATAAQADARRLEASTRWAAAKWAGNVWMAYLGRLIRAWQLPPTSDGRPTLELGLALVSDVGGQADEVDEDGTVVEGALGYHAQTTMPNLIAALPAYFALRGWEVPREWTAAWVGAAAAARCTVHDDAVCRSSPAFLRHIREAEEVLAAGDGEWWLTGDLSRTPRYDLLVMSALVESNSVHGRREASVSELATGDVAYRQCAELGGYVADLRWNRDGKCDSAMFGIGLLEDLRATAKLMHVELALGVFQHATMAEVLVCPAKRVAALALPLLRAWDEHGVPSHEAYGARRGAFATAVVLGMDGRHVTGHAGRSAVMAQDFSADAERYGTRAEVCPERSRLKTGWVEDGGRNQAPVRAYGRAFAAKALIAIAKFDEDTAEHRAKRRRILEQLQDDEVPRRPDFDRASARRGAEGVALEARRRYSGRVASALLSRAGGPAPAALPPCAHRRRDAPADALARARAQAPAAISSRRCIAGA